MKYCVTVIVTLFFYANTCFAQSLNVDASVGLDSKGTLLIYNLCPGVGYSFTDKDYVFGGIKYQSYVLIPKSNRDEYDSWSTNTISNFLLYGGGRYLLPFAKTKKNTPQELTFGFAPEVKAYFNPYVPRGLKYINSLGEGKSVRGGYSCQIAYSVGLGIYFDSKESNQYFAIMFEYSTLDAFKTIRNLDFEGEDFRIPTAEQFSIGFSIFCW